MSLYTLYIFRNNYVIFLIAFSSSFFLLISQFTGYDIWWHIQLGENIISKGTVYLKDTISYTNYGNYFTVHSWLSDCIFYLIFLLGGESGLKYFRFVIFIIFYIVSWFLCYHFSKNFEQSSLFSVIAVYLIHDHVVRPYIFPPLICLLLIATQIFSTRSRRIFSRIILILLWANLHPSFPLAVVLSIFMTLVFDYNWNKPLLFVESGIYIIAGLIQPFGFYGYLYPFKAMKYPTYDWYSLFHMYEIYGIPTGIIIVYGILIIVYIQLASSVVSNFSIQYLLFMLFNIVIVLISLSIMRFFWLLIIPFTLSLFIFPRQCYTNKYWIRYMSIFIIVTLACAKIYNDKNTINVPSSLITFINEADINANDFVYLPWAGKLNFCTNGSIKVFADTRIEPFIYNELKEYNFVLLESQNSNKILHYTDLIVVPKKLLFNPNRIFTHNKWIPIWKCSKSFVYARKNNTLLLNKIKAYYTNHNIPFDEETGINVASIIQYNPNWSKSNLNLNNVDLETLQYLFGQLNDVSSKQVKNEMMQEIGYLFYKQKFYNESLFYLSFSDNSTDLNIDDKLRIAKCLYCIGNIDLYNKYINNLEKLYPANSEIKKFNAQINKINVIRKYSLKALQ